MSSVPSTNMWKSVRCRALLAALLYATALVGCGAVRLRTAPGTVAVDMDVPPVHATVEVRATTDTLWRIVEWLSTWWMLLRTTDERWADNSSH